MIHQSNSFAHVRPLAAVTIALALAATLGACASSEKAPKEQMAVSRAAVERASGPAAAEAPIEVSQARAKLDRANIAMTREDYVDARRLAEEAEVDANLAEAKSHSVRSDRALAEVRAGIRQLQDEIARR